MPTPSTYSSSFSSSLTGVAIVDSLISGTYWLGSNWSPLGPTNLSYSFMAPGTSYFITNYSPDNEYNALYELTAGQKLAVTSALSAWSAVANINFTLTTDTIANVGDLRFGGYRLMDDQTAAWAYFPANNPAAGDVWVGPQTNDPNPGKGTYDYLTFVHEIGHALGLKHPFDTSATNKTLLDPKLDDVHFTVMSYNSNYSYQPTTPMVLDILVIQSLYGANVLWQTGDNVYKWDAGQSIFETIWDAGGNDTIDASNQLSAVGINLNEGAYSQIGKTFVDYTNMTAVNDGLAIAYGAKIENATGSAFNDVLIGNTLDNTLNGMAGADTMSGGTGNDIYIVDNIADVVIETSTLATEIDTVRSSVDWVLGANLENLVLTGTDNLTATGNSLNNVLTGNDGNNSLLGGLGADTLIGGAGNDIYGVENVNDVVIELAGEGRDLIRTKVSYTLSDNVEDGTLLDSADLTLTGNALDNVLTGNAGNNSLLGGLGADTLIGGAGDDIYGVENVNDVVIELANEGHDLIRSRVSYTLSANVEDGILLDSTHNNLTGNALNNVLTGNAGNNILDGGLGADTLIGGAGDDTYVVDNINDVLVEQANEGRDLVKSSISYVLSSNFEDATLLGSSDLTLTGNALDNVLTGNAGNNSLLGGVGADTLIGGAGDDIYGVENVNDVVIELANEGHDLIRSRVSYTLSANVEDGILLDSTHNNLTGNALNNVLTGNAGNNILDGGLGADTLIGGAGDDTYVVDNINDVLVEQADEGRDLVKTSISYVLANNFEDATLLGTADLTLTGNSLNNVLIGNAGNNSLLGGLGADTLIGGAGNDIYGVENVNDVVIELAGEGRDLIRTKVSYTLSDNVEDGTLLDSADLTLTGNALDNVLTGNAGNNSLLGGLGADTLIGGAGDDIYGVENVNDVVIELANEGHDLIRSRVSYTLSANVEDGILLDSTHNNLTGNDLNNVLTGNAGNNILDGGAGADTLIGGAGDDIYVVDNYSDVVTEQVGEGHDLVRTSISYTLSANVEDLTAIGNDIAALTGNALNNVIRGNSNVNYIDGGLGADTMIGGAGNDVYTVDNVNDVVTELADEGIDTVNVSIDYTLTDNVEDGQMIGSANLNMTGNDLDNTLHGNAGNNILSGGLGADRMIGEGGDDIYIVDNVNDLVFESSFSGGHDLIRTTVDFTLSDNVEDGEMLGNADLALYGNALDNVLIGNSGNNVLFGNAGNDKLFGADGNDTLYGGWGNTTLTGGTGADRFTFSSNINLGIEFGSGASHNVITDFNALEGDKIDFSGFDADPMTLGLQHMTFIGANEFTGTGQLRFADHVLSGNLSESAGGYFEVHLLGVNALSANDVLV